MNKMDVSLRELREMDELALRRSPVHSLCPLSKLLTAVAYIAVTASFGKYDLSGLTVMVLYPVLLFQLSGIPVGTCFRKLRLAMPLVMAVGLFNPILDRAPLFTLGGVTVSRGMISMVTLMAKGVFCLMASFLLMATTPIDSLCAALRQLRVPGVLVTLLLLTYRYAGVMTEELSVMTDAYSLRAPGQKGVHHSAWGSFLGQLLLRSMDRAQELYNSMQLRGFRDEFHYAKTQPFTGRDAAYLGICLAAFLTARFVPLARILGSLFVR